MVDRLAVLRNNTSSSLFPLSSTSKSCLYYKNEPVTSLNYKFYILIAISRPTAPCNTTIHVHSIALLIQYPIFNIFLTFLQHKKKTLTHWTHLCLDSRSLSIFYNNRKSKNWIRTNIALPTAYQCSGNTDKSMYVTIKSEPLPTINKLSH